MSVRCEYDKTTADFPILTKHVSHASVTMPGNAPVAYERVAECDLRPLQDPEEEMFKLSAFGLPEPQFESDSLLWVWVLNLGVLLVIVAFLLRWRAARRA